MPSASMALMSEVFAMTTLCPMTFLASLPVCLRLMVNVLQLLLMSMLATLYFIASLPSMSAEQVAANAEGASAISAAAARNLRIMGITSRVGKTLGVGHGRQKDNVNYGPGPAYVGAKAADRIPPAARPRDALRKAVFRPGLRPAVAPRPSG